jgi:hypothetical protein
MLQTYHAEIMGSHLQWLGTAPAHALRQRAVIVFDTPLPLAAPKPVAINSFMAARGALGKSTRDEVLSELATMRDEWQR